MKILQRMNCSTCYVLASRGHKAHRRTLVSPSPSMSSVQTLKTQLHCDPSFLPLEKRLLWAAFTLAFYGFLRASELATSTLIWQHNEHIHLVNDRYTVFIEQSKTDPFCCGHTITIHETGTSTYPVRAFRLYAEASTPPSANSPAFKGGKFSPLDRQQLTTTIRHLLQNTQYNH